MDLRSFIKMEKIVVVGANHTGTACINTILDNYKDKKVVCAVAKDGSKIEESYDKLILATGSLPVAPKFEGMDLENVQFVKLYQNAAEVIEKLKNNDIKKVAVVGAGYIGVELAEAFKRNGRDVVLIDSAETCLSSYYDSDFTDMMSKNLQDHGIELVYGQKVEKILGDKKVEKIVTDKAEFDVDMVVLCIGFKPNNELGKEHLELFKNGAFLVNKKQQTSQQDVFAIGDCATVFDNSINDTNYIALATNAVRSGIIAAHNACGTEIESIGVQGSNGISIWGLNMVSTGLTLEKAKANGFNATTTEYEDLQKPEFIEHDNETVKLKIVYDKDTRVILGTQMCSKEDISMGIHMFSLAVQEKVTIDKLKLLDIFFLPHFNKPYNYIYYGELEYKINPQNGTFTLFEMPHNETI